MSRYIDADALKEEFTCKGDEWINNIIDSEPTIDAVSVVRCKECRHWWNKYGDSACMLHSDFTVDADDFCSYAERREP